MAFRKKIINPKLQLKSAIFITGLTAIAFCAVFGIFFYSLISENKKMNQTASDLSSAITVENDIVGAFVTYSKTLADQRLFLANDKITSDHKESMQKIQTHIDGLKISVEKNNRLIYISLCIFVFFMALIFITIINLTHKISGPIYVISQYMESLINGKKIELRKLRNGDELKEFYKTFSDLVEKIQNGKKN